MDIPFGEWPAALEIPAAQSYRAKQVLEWIFEKRVKTFDEMTNIPAPMRDGWKKRFVLRSMTVEGKEASALDGTTRLFFRASDGGQVSAVFLPARSPKPEDAGPAADGEAPNLTGEASDNKTEAPRYALCLSTQVGCAWGCVFCASGRVKYERNLTFGEIIEQVLWAEEVTGKHVGSLLYMGMGEPLANYDNVLTSLRTFRSPLAFNIGARHVTVSTCGLVPQILKLSEEAPKINLAISLHAADDEKRKMILPKSSHWPIKDLLKAAWSFQRGMGDGRVTFEYILLKGVNDSEREAQRLSNLLRDKNAWVNLIVYNPVPGLPYEVPEEASVEAFAQILKDRGLFVRVRRPQGRDIQAGCGQLGRPTAV